MNRLEFKYWLNSIAISLFVTLVCGLYLFARDDTFFPFLKYINKTAGFVAIVLIGVSFAILPFYKFTHKYPSLMVYRKSLGIIGFFFALLHGILSAFVLYSIPRLLKYDPLGFSFGLAGLIILLIDFSISNKYVVQTLGFKTWKWILRTAYLAALFSLIHMGLKGFKSWLLWFSNPFSLPPFGIVVLIFMILVFIARIVLIFYEVKKSKEINLHYEK